MFKVQPKDKPKDHTVVLDKEAYEVLVDTAKQNHASIKETASQMILYANDAPPISDECMEYEPIHEIVNATPHPVVVLLEDGARKEFPPMWNAARVVRTFTQAVYVDGVPVQEVESVSQQFMPPKKYGTAYIVRGITANALKGKRNDLLVINDAVKDASGNVVACKKLLRV